MTGDDLLQLRKATGLSRVEFMREMGHGGAENTLFQRISRYESGRVKPIPPAFARLAYLILMAHTNDWVPVRDGKILYPDIVEAE